MSATVGLRPQIKEPVAWPVSEALFNVGFRDSYRDVHPDPAKSPGITWPAKRPKVAAWAGNPSPSDPRDRIDYVYAAGPSKTLASEIMGEKGGPDVSLSVTPWPSDHRAVVSTFEVTPLAMPTMVAVNARLLTVGDTVNVTYNAPGKSGDKAAIVTAGGDLASALMSQDAPGEKGTLTFDTSRLAAGGYEAVLTAGDGAEVARVPFWLRAKHAKVQLSTDKPTYAVGEPITVSWTDGPANRWDWIGVYKASAADPNVDYYLIWDYTGLHASGTVPPQVDGSVTLGGSSQGSRGRCRRASMSCTTCSPTPTRRRAARRSRLRSRGRRAASPGATPFTTLNPAGRTWVYYGGWPAVLLPRVRESSRLVPRGASRCLARSSSPSSSW